jgi:hypothetical protein
MSKKYTNQDVADVLLKARDLMNNRGKHWIKGQMKKRLSNGEYGYCSMGAIEAATQSKALQRRAYLALRNVTDPTGVAFFNDFHTTTWGDVSRAFRKAAKQVLAS